MRDQETSWNQCAVNTEDLPIQGTIQFSDRVALANVNGVVAAGTPTYKSMASAATCKVDLFIRYWSLLQVSIL